MAINVLGVVNNLTAVPTPVSQWVDLVPPLNVTATADTTALFQATVQYYADEMLLKVFLDGVEIGTGDSTRSPLVFLAAVTAGTHTVKFQGFYTGSMNPGTPTSSNQSLSVIGLT